MSNSLVSIIIPCYNSENYIVAAIESALNQTHRDIEIICVNDGSSDRTGDILDKMSNDHEQIQVKHTCNQGGGMARNVGFEMSKGEYIQFLDADDWLDPEKIKRQLTAMDSLTDVVISDYATFDVDLKSKHSQTICSKFPDTPLDYSIRHVITTINPLYRRDVLERFKYDVSLRAAQDWEFHLRLVLNDVRFKYLPGILFKIRRTSDSVSSNWFRVAQIQGGIIGQYEEDIRSHSLFEKTTANFICQLYYNIAVYTTKSYTKELEKIKAWSNGTNTFIKNGFKRKLANIVGIRTLIVLDRLRSRKMIK